GAGATRRQRISPNGELYTRFFGLRPQNDRPSKSMRQKTRLDPSTSIEHSARNKGGRFHGSIQADLSGFAFRRAAHDVGRADGQEVPGPGPAHGHGPQRPRRGVVRVREHYTDAGRWLLRRRRALAGPARAQQEGL